LFHTGAGSDLVLNRTFRASSEDVWASITEPDRTARWFGRWEGDAAPGRTIKVQMAFEEGAPWFDLRIEACDPPRRLAVSAVDEHGTWNLELLVSESGGRTELRLVHHLESADKAAEVGPGWEYYLDLLVADREGTPQPRFDDYQRAMQTYYEQLIGTP
jgi:uncharacterized protein YndB with AHSA1/START domain